METIDSLDALNDKDISKIIESDTNIRGDIQKHFNEMLSEHKNNICQKYSKYKLSIKQNIQNTIDVSHNPNLIDPQVSPNENTIYKLYNDFSITSEKGGWAYGQRNIFLFYPPLRINIDQTFNFPMAEEYTKNKKYAIMELETCISIRKKYEFYQLLSL